MYFLFVEIFLLTFWRVVVFFVRFFFFLEWRGIWLWILLYRDRISILRVVYEYLGYLFFWFVVGINEWKGKILLLKFVNVVIWIFFFVKICESLIYFFLLNKKSYYICKWNGYLVMDLIKLWLGNIFIE